MFEIFLALTGLVLVTGVFLAYRTTRDILHPVLFLGPLFLFSCVVEPWLIRSELFRFFENPEDLNVVLVLNLLAVTSLMAGGLHYTTVRRTAHPIRGPRRLDHLTLTRVAALLALLGLAAYFTGIVNAGGFTAAFSKVKGGGVTGSGFIGESTNLGPWERWAEVGGRCAWCSRLRCLPG
jgi:hypothetical protein